MHTSRPICPTGTANNLQHDGWNAAQLTAPPTIFLDNAIIQKVNGCDDSECCYCCHFRYKSGGEFYAEHYDNKAGECHKRAATIMVYLRLVHTMVYLRLVVMLFHL